MSERDTPVNPVVKSIRKTLQRVLHEAFETDAPVLIEALPGSGKSYGVVAWAKETESPLTILTARHDLYDQYKDFCELHGLEYGRIPSHYRDCPFGEKYDGKRPGDIGEWSEMFEDLFNQYGSARRVHREVEDLPCQRHGDCPYVVEYENFDVTDYDVVVGHYHHANAPFPGWHSKPGRYIKDRYVAFDEFPDDAVVETVPRYSRVVTNYLSKSPELPYDSNGEVEANVLIGTPNDADQAAIDEWLTEHEGELFDGNLATNDKRMHPFAPALVRAAFSWDILDNGWRRAELSYSAVAVKSPSDDEIYLLQRPPVDSLAKSVIALDGTPSAELWRIVLGPDLEFQSVHEDNEAKRAYIRDGLGLQFIQTTPAIKPYATAEYLDHQKNRETDEWYADDSTAKKDMLVYRWICQQERKLGKPGFITTLSAKNVYKDYGLLELVTVEAHYNDIKGSNEFGAIRLGIIAGCNAPNNERVQMWAAFADESVKPQKNDDGEQFRGTLKGYGPFGDRILVGLRENEVLQAGLRFARKPDTGDQPPARVYLHTAAVPDWLRPERRYPTPRLWKQAKGMGKLLTVIREGILPAEEWTSGDALTAVHERFGDEKIVSRTVTRCLRQLRETGVLQGERRTGEGSGSGRGYTYQSPQDYSGLVLVHDDGYVLPPATESDVLPDVSQGAAM